MTDKIKIAEERIAEAGENALYFDGLYEETGDEMYKEMRDHEIEKMKKIKAAKEKAEKKDPKTFVREIANATGYDVERVNSFVADINELGNNAHNMKYSELKPFGFLAKAVVTMIVFEVKDADKSLDLLERFLRDELTGGEVEKIIQGE